MKITKNTYIIVLAVILALLAGLGLVYYFIQKPEAVVTPTPTPEETPMSQIIEDLTAPGAKEVRVSGKLQEDLTAPEEAAPTPVPKEIINNLTAPE